MSSFNRRMVPGPRKHLSARKDSQLDQVSDEELMASVQKGDGNAFGVLFDRYHRLVLFTALKIVKDVAEAEEVTQNVFFEIYRVAEKFDAAKGSLKVWLLQYAYHRSMNRRNYLLFRQFYSNAALEDALDWEEGAQIQPQIFGPEVTRAIRQALETLNDAQRRTIEMVHYQGLTLKEVADKTKQSLSNVRNHYYRGLDRLRKCLKEKPVRDDKAMSLTEVNHVRA